MARHLCFPQHSPAECLRSGPAPANCTLIRLHSVVFVCVPQCGWALSMIASHNSLPRRHVRSCRLVFALCGATGAAVSSRCYSPVPHCSRRYHRRGAVLVTGRRRSLHSRLLNGRWMPLPADVRRPWRCLLFTVSTRAVNRLESFLSASVTAPPQPPSHTAASLSVGSGARLSKTHQLFAVPSEVVSCMSDIDVILITAVGMIRDHRPLPATATSRHRHRRRFSCVSARRQWRMAVSDGR